MRRGAPSGEHAGFRQQEGAGADRRDPANRRRLAAHPLDRGGLFHGVLDAAAARYDQRIDARFAERASQRPGDQRQPRRRRDRTAAARHHHHPVRRSVRALALAISLALAKVCTGPATSRSCTRSKARTTTRRGVAAVLSVLWRTGISQGWQKIAGIMTLLPSLVTGEIGVLRSRAVAGSAAMPSSSKPLLRSLPYRIVAVSAI